MAKVIILLLQHKRTGAAAGAAAPSKSGTGNPDADDDNVKQYGHGVYCIGAKALCIQRINVTMS
ncbi:hypothetical protein, partial [Sodalis-like endosymbiont of Proechinophthirus fluctus]|uniref:hypothetical protein n=1 Tax=Sodalis-like endosymbiont of Proechinophthirus fluctus TaxID=1462730 RepID=UPI00195EED9E